MPPHRNLKGTSRGTLAAGGFLLGGTTEGNNPGDPTGTDQIADQKRPTCNELSLQHINKH